MTQDASADESTDWTVHCYTSGDTSWYSEDQSTFTINTADELAGLAKLVTIDQVSFEGKTVLLGSDIDLSEVCGPGTGLSWLPIGHDAATYGSFKGTFDGQDHTISNLYADLSMMGVGLFGSVKNGNVGNFKVSGQVTGNYHVAGAVAYCQNTNLYNIESSVDVTADAPNGGDGDAGGVVGYSMTSYGSDNTFTSLVNKGNVTGSGYYTGGVIGFMGTAGTSITVSKCANLGNVFVNDNGSGSGDANEAAGGVIGSTTGSIGSFYISECFNAGNVDGGGLKTSGGIAGYLGGNGSSITGCYNCGSISGGSNSGGIAGYLGAQDGSIQCTYNIGSVNGSNAGGTLGNASNASQTLGSNFSSADLSGEAASAYGSSVEADNTGTALTIDQLRSQELLDILNRLGNFFDWDNPAATDNPANDGYPYLVWQNLIKGTPNGGIGDGGNPGDGDGGESSGGQGDSGEAGEPSGEPIGDSSGGDEGGDTDTPDDSDDNNDGDNNSEPGDTEIDDSGGSDPDDQNGQGSGIEDEDLDDYDIPEDEPPSKIDTDKLTPVVAVTEKPQQAKKDKKTEKAKKSKKSKKTKKKDSSQTSESSSQLVKVGMAAAGGSSVGGSGSALGGAVNWLLLMVLMCLAAGVAYELWRFKHLQPTKTAPPTKGGNDSMEVSQ